MCDAATLGLVSMGGQLLGGLFGADAASTESAANRDAYLMQASIDRTNAELADMRADDAIVRGNLETQRIHRGMERARHGLKASRGASGVAMDVGSPLAVFAGLDAIEAVDTATAKKNAAREEFAYRVEADNLRRSAGMKAGRAAQENPSMAGFTSLLGTATQVAGSWYAMKQAGVKF